MFDNIVERQADGTDFRVSFIRFENGQARISVGPKEPASLVHNVLVEPSIANQFSVNYSAWDDFYSRIESGPALTRVNSDDIGKYTPATPEETPYVWPDGKLREGGEFVIPLKTEIFFYVVINGTYSKDDNANLRDTFIGFWNLNRLNTQNPEYNLRIDFGTRVPADLPARKNPITGVWTYVFYLPIFRIIVTNTEVDLEMYDIGECCFISEQADRQPNVLNFAKVSSYYD